MTGLSLTSLSLMSRLNVSESSRDYVRKRLRTKLNTNVLSMTWLLSQCDHFSECIATELMLWIWLMTVKHDTKDYGPLPSGCLAHIPSSLTWDWILLHVWCLNLHECFQELWQLLTDDRYKSRATKMLKMLIGGTSMHLTLYLVMISDS